MYVYIYVYLVLFDALAFIEYRVNYIKHVTLPHTHHTHHTHTHPPPTHLLIYIYRTSTLYSKGGKKYFSLKADLTSIYVLLFIIFSMYHTYIYVYVKLYIVLLKIQHSYVQYV